MRGSVLKLILSLGVLFAFVDSAWSQYVGGNAGEGILDGSELYLRDLFERDLHNNIFRGTEIKEPMRSLVSQFQGLSLTDGQRQLLAIKLTDAEILYPCFGELLGKALKMYTWLLVKEELALLPQDGMIRIFPEEQRVQLANRIGSFIHVHEASWRRLNDENKIALLIHEAAYALTKLDPHSRKQSPFFAMEATALVFSGKQTSESTNNLISTLLGMKRNLMDSRTKNFCSERKATIEFSVSIPVPDNLSQRVAYFEFPKADPRLADTDLQKICHIAFQKIRSKPDRYIWGIGISMTSYDPLNLEFRNYRTRDFGVQMVLDIALPPDGTKEKWLYFENARQCVRAVRSHMNEVSKP